jgi:uncharacterized protein (DUF488 family)
MTTTLYTIGHSTRPIDELIALLQQHAISTLVDIRSIPHSRRHPQFSKENLSTSLKRAGIAYRHMKSLGGLRKPGGASVNRAWRNDAFRGYADYMQTEEFERSVDELVGVAAQARTSIMCAEGAPARCHRSLVADALLARSIPVMHILSANEASAHALTPSARVVGTSVSYPA